MGGIPLLRNASSYRFVFAVVRLQYGLMPYGPPWDARWGGLSGAVFSPDYACEREKPASLLTQAKCGDEGFVPRRVVPAEIAQQTTPLSHEHYEPALGVVVLAVHPQMLR